MNKQRCILCRKFVEPEDFDFFTDCCCPCLKGGDAKNKKEEEENT